MKPNVFLQSTFRKPIQTLLLLLLIGFSAFGFVSSTTEYWIVKEETRRTSEYYQSVGVLLPSDPGQTDVTEGALYLANNPHIAISDWRRVAIGLMPEGMSNADTDGTYANSELYYEDSGYPMTYINDVLFYGTLKSVKILFKPNEDMFEFNVDTVLAGRTEYIRAGKINVRSLRSVSSEVLQSNDIHKPSEAIASSPSPTPTSSEVGTEPSAEMLAADPFLGLQADARYLIRARYDSANRALYIIKLQPGGPAYLTVEDDSINALESGKLDKLRSDMELLQFNHRSMTLISTQNMNAIPSRWEGERQLGLSQGRWLSENDTTEQRYVCMVHEDFATKYGLSLGDVIPLQLFDNRQKGLVAHGLANCNRTESSVLSIYAYFEFTGYMTAEALNTSAFIENPQKYEIVGIYNLRTEKTATSDNNVMYIPEPCMPAEFGGYTLTVADKNLYSFVLHSYKEMDAFQEETQAALKEMGLRVSFIDNNAQVFGESMESLGTAKLLSLIIYALLLLLALALTVFLYLRLRQKEYAIQRALGLPYRNARSALHSPIAIIGVAGICAGGLLGWDYALKQASESLAGVQQGILESYAPPSWILLIALCLAVFVILVLFVRVGSIYFSRCSVLTLLHGSSAAKRGKKHG